MVLTPLILAESALEIAYFLQMKPDIITSCCGSLFSPASRGIAAEIAAAPSIPMKFAFYAATGLTLITGARFILKGRPGYLFALLSGVTFLVSLVALISFISLYIYEMPSHHCPFCILQKEYHYLGYPLYVTLLLGSVTGMGVGVLMPFRSRPSLAATLPGFQRRLALTSVISWLLFTLLATWPIVFSSFRLEGY